MRMRQLCAGLASLALGGCYTFEGPPQIINGGGVVNQSGQVSARSENLKDNFRLAVDRAAADTAGAAEVDRMIATGVALVRTNCDDFFRQMGSVQRGSRIGRDMIAPVIGVLTGIVALKGFSGARADGYLQGITLGSTAAFAGIDIVDRHFLFGAENIYEVEQLTFRALAAHQAGIASAGPMNFENAVMQLIDHQVICTPASILDLTKRAIAAGDVTPVKGAGSAGGATDGPALDSLGAALGLIGAATPQQAGALYWLYKGGAAGAELPLVGKALSGTPQPALLSADGGATFTLNAAAAPSRAAIVKALDALSAETKRSFDASIAAARKTPGISPGFTLPAPSDAVGKVGLRVD